MMPSIGVDVVRLEVLAAYVDEPGALELGWTEAELMDAGGDVEVLASQWAVKEAVMKVLGIGIGQISPKDIVVARHAGEAPVVSLLGPALRRHREAHLGNISISISHDSHAVTAVAIALATDGGEPLDAG